MAVYRWPTTTTTTFCYPSWGRLWSYRKKNNNDDDNRNSIGTLSRTLFSHSTSSCLPILLYVFFLLVRFTRNGHSIRLPPRRRSRRRRIRTTGTGTQSAASHHSIRFILFHYCIIYYMMTIVIIPMFVAASSLPPPPSPSSNAFLLINNETTTTTTTNQDREPFNIIPNINYNPSIKNLSAGVDDDDDDDDDDGEFSYYTSILFLRSGPALLNTTTTTSNSLPSGGRSMIATKHKRQTVIATTVQRTTMSANTEFDVSMSSAPPDINHRNHTSPKPKLGFGNFRFLGDDDEDYDESDLIDDIKPRIDRVLISGDPAKLPSSNLLSLMQQASSMVDFVGCYCDHYHNTERPPWMEMGHSNYEHHSSSSSQNFEYFKFNNNNDDVRKKKIRAVERISQEKNTYADTNHRSSSSGTRPDNEPEVIYCYCFGETITEIPSNFSKSVQKIVLKRVGLKELKAGVLQRYPKLTEIYMQAVHSLHYIEPGAFSHLPDLISIYIKMAPQLSRIMKGVFAGTLLKLMHLKVTHTGLELLPKIVQEDSEDIISMLDFDNNRIRNISRRSILVNAESLYIEFNQIEFISDYAFQGSKIAKLSLKGNKRLVHLDQNAFAGINYLRELDLSQTSITRLPTIGLSEWLEVLRITDTFTLKEIPFIYHFKSMKVAHLTYSYHCCAFQFPANHDPAEYERIKNLFNTDKYCPEKKRKDDHAEEFHSTTSSSVNSLMSSTNRQRRPKLPRLKRFSVSEPKQEHRTEKPVYGEILFKEPGEIVAGSIGGTSYVPPKPEPHLPKRSEELPGTFGNPYATIMPRSEEFCGDIENRMPAVECYPTPDAFNPCEDVMGRTYLRVVVWLVAFAAVSGNAAVIVVLVSSRFTFNVSKFLMINLSIADLMMGVYLFIIAVVDLRTQGVYFNYAIDWQHGMGCKVAGFITVFAQLLSIFTLTVITLERLFAITYAIQLNRRLKLNLAVKVMIAGWFFVIAMAALPLFGISSYSKTSICLPMEHRTVSDLIYLVLLLVINQLAFIIICACYSKMYFSIVSQKTRANMNDMTIAKRMALLVFTDFACWAPIAFFGLTAIAGYPLIDVTNSKILLVTIYPLNSCANPFLYVIFTKQYRRDFFILVSRYGFCKKKALRYKPPRHHLHPNYRDHRHHHHHHRFLPDSAPNTNSQQEPKPKPPGHHHQGSSSVCRQTSFDTSHNLHLYKYRCKYSSHFCAMYHHQPDNQSCHPMSSSCESHYHTDIGFESSTDPYNFGNFCQSPAQLEFSSDPNVQMSIHREEEKHRKHKRCHHSCCRYGYRHHQHHSHCRESCGQKNLRDQPAAAGTAAADANSPTEKPEGESSSHGRQNSQERVSSSYEKVHILTNHHHQCHHGGASSMDQNMDHSMDNRVVVFTRNKTADVSQTQGIIGNHHHHHHHHHRQPVQQKRGSIFYTLMHRLSISRLLMMKGGGEPGSPNCAAAGGENGPDGAELCGAGGGESCSPYSSSNSLSNPYWHNQRHHHHHHHRYHHHHHRYHHCHHFRCYTCQPKTQLPIQESGNHNGTEQKSPGDKNQTDQSPSNVLPMEEQREILRQALQESTTIQEAVAVVEELSSGARVSSMGSSSSSRKA